MAIACFATRSTAAANGSPEAKSSAADDDTVLLTRTALHARRIKFQHPRTGHDLEIEAPLPKDIEAVLAFLREHKK